MKKIVLYILLLILIFKIYPLDWFKTQLGTGVGNCGPAVAAMLIERQGYNITVQQARSIIGYKQLDGATSVEDLKTILREYNIDFFIIDLKDYIDGAMIVLLNMSKIHNKSHDYNGNHYVVVFGIKDNYYRVYDPLVKGEQLYSIKEVELAQEREIIWTK